MVLDLLLEMNEDVKGEYRTEDPRALIQQLAGHSGPEAAAAALSFFRSFNLVIATQFSEEELLPLADALFSAGVPLMLARSYGLLGSVRSIVPEHRVAESRLDRGSPDLRICKPFPALRAFADSINLATLSDIEHAHVPYVLLLIKALDSWRAEVRKGRGRGEGGEVLSLCTVTSVLPLPAANVTSVYLSLQPM